MKLKTSKFLIKRPKLKIQIIRIKLKNIIFDKLKFSNKIENKKNFYKKNKIKNKKLKE